MKIKSLEEKIQKKIGELESLAYQPGTFYCPKCSCVVHQRSISMSQFEIGTTKKDRTDPQLCPNDCGILEPETYKNICKGQDGVIDKLFEFLESKSLIKEYHQWKETKVKGAN